MSVTETGPLLASGRDADIYEYGPRLVLRRSRTPGRSMEGEARTMEYVRSHGFPVPAVEFVSDDATELVMERLSGPSMLGLLERRPWSLRSTAAVLADLHHRLHEIPAPDWVRRAPWGGDTGEALLHLDLHPLNVMMTGAGPVVIDWTNASAGSPASDVALTWAIVACAEIPGGAFKRAAFGRFRAGLVSAFLGHFDVDAVLAHLGPVVGWKVADANLGEAEKTSMRALVRRQAQDGEG